MRVFCPLAMQGLTFCCLLLAVAPSAWAQPLENPYARNDSTWYNRKVGAARYLLHILQGNPQLALRHAEAQIQDAEADFMRAVAYAHMEMADSALFFVELALEKRLPMGRFLAGNPRYLQPLHALPGFEPFRAAAPQVIHGPMLGKVTHRGASVWIRTQTPGLVTLELSARNDFSKPLRVAGYSRQEDGCAITLRAEGLKPATRYFYRVMAGALQVGDTHTFATTPPPGKPAGFSVIFGGGAAFIPWRHNRWSVIATHRPDALLMLGDNVYIDYPEEPEIQAYCYHQRQSEPHWRRLIAQTPVYAIWDDHDFGDNDDFGGPQPDSPAWKVDVLRLFKQQWPDPGYGGAQQLLGVFFTHSYGAVDFFFLDGRYYRQPSEAGALFNPGLSMLGEAQKKWLKAELAASKAVFKVIVSPVPWAFGSKGQLEGRIDPWSGYPGERKELFDFLADNRINGVLLLSADRHRSDLWKIDRPNGYMLYEFESSRLTNSHYHPVLPEAVFGFNQTNSFGKLSFDFAQPDPRAIYEVYAIDQTRVFRIEVSLSQISH